MDGKKVTQDYELQKAKRKHKRISQPIKDLFWSMLIAIPICCVIFFYFLN